MLTRKDVDKLEALVGQLEGIHSELTLLAKKSGNDAVNEFKLKLINSAIAECNKLLGGQYKPFNDFDVFDPALVPSNSDVTFIAKQYLQALEKFRSDNIRKDMYNWYYVTDNKGEQIMTTAPKRLSKK